MPTINKLNNISFCSANNKNLTIINGEYPGYNYIPTQYHKILMRHKNQFGKFAKKHNLNIMMYSVDSNIPENMSKSEEAFWGGKLAIKIEKIDNIGKRYQIIAPFNKDNSFKVSRETPVVALVKYTGCKMQFIENIENILREVTGDKSKTLLSKIRHFFNKIRH